MGARVHGTGSSGLCTPFRQTEAELSDVERARCMAAGCGASWASKVGRPLLRAHLHTRPLGGVTALTNV